MSFAALDAITIVARTILAFAVWFVVPLGLAVAVPSVDAPGATFARRARRTWPLGAACLCASLTLPAGSASFALAAPWLVTAAFVAFAAIERLKARVTDRFDPAELAIDAGMLYLPVGAAWASVSRANVDVLGFAGTKALLTANHFHFAGFGACVLVGAIGRRPGRGRLWYVAAAGTVAGIALVAAGITLSHAVEVAAAWMLAASVVIVAGLVGREALRTRGWARALFAVSAVAGLAPAALAVHFSMTGFERLSDAAFRRMVLFHGLVNAVGFVGAGLAGARLARKQA